MDPMQVTSRSFLRDAPSPPLPALPVSGSTTRLRLADASSDRQVRSRITGNVIPQRPAPRCNLLELARLPTEYGAGYDGGENQCETSDGTPTRVPRAVALALRAEVRRRQQEQCHPGCSSSVSIGSSELLELLQELVHAYRRQDSSAYATAATAIADRKGRGPTGTQPEIPEAEIGAKGIGPKGGLTNEAADAVRPLIVALEVEPLMLGMRTARSPPKICPDNCELLQLVSAAVDRRDTQFQEALSRARWFVWMRKATIGPRKSAKVAPSPYRVHVAPSGPSWALTDTEHPESTHDDGFESIGASPDRQTHNIAAGSDSEDETRAVGYGAGYGGCSQALGWGSAGTTHHNNTIVKDPVTPTETLAFTGPPMTSTIVLNTRRRSSSSPASSTFTGSLGAVTTEKYFSEGGRLGSLVRSGSGAC